MSNNKAEFKLPLISNNNNNSNINTNLVSLIRKPQSNFRKLVSEQNNNIRNKTN